MAIPRRPQRHDPGRGPSAESWLRDRTPELRHVRVIYKPGPGTAGLERQRRQVSEKGLYAAEKARRRSGAAAFRSSWSEIDEADTRAGCLHRRSSGRTLQSIPLPVLRKISHKEAQKFCASLWLFLISPKEHKADRMLASDLARSREDRGLRSDGAPA